MDPEDDAETDDERRIPGGPAGHDVHENNFVEFSVRCRKCGLRMCRVTAEVFQGGLNGPDFYDPMLGKDDEEHRHGYGRSLECLYGGDEMPTRGPTPAFGKSYYPNWIQSFMFVCVGKRCGFKRPANRFNVVKAMRKAWKRGSYEIVAGEDF